MVQCEENQKSKTPYFAYLSFYSVFVFAHALCDILYLRITSLSGQWYAKPFLFLIISIISRLLFVPFLARKNSNFRYFWAFYLLFYVLYWKSLPSGVDTVLFVLNNMEYDLGRISSGFYLVIYPLCYLADSNHFRAAFGFPLKKIVKDNRKGAEMFRRPEKMPQDASPAPFFNDENTPDEIHS